MKKQVRENVAKHMKEVREASQEARRIPFDVWIPINFPMCSTLGCGEKATVQKAIEDGCSETPRYFPRSIEFMDDGVSRYYACDKCAGRELLEKELRQHKD